MSDDRQPDAFWTTEEGEVLTRILTAESTWAEPSSELEARVVASVAVDRAVDPDGAGIAPIETARQRRHQRLVKSVPWLVAAAAVVALIVAIGPRPDRSSPQFTAALAGSNLAPGARASAEFIKKPNGVETHLHITGLARAPDGFVYEAWVKGPQGLVPLGTFHSSGEVILWSGVELDDYPEITVTIQPIELDPKSSRQRVMSGVVKRH